MVGEFYEIEYLLNWFTVSRSVFDTNTSMIKVINGRAHRVCIDCFHYLTHVKRNVLNIVKNREIGRKVYFHKSNNVMTLEDVDFQLRMMIHCYKNDIDLWWGY
jgi:hypothetical protein